LKEENEVGKKQRGERRRRGEEKERRRRGEEKERR
jgi:hypothetical protein